MKKCPNPSTPCYEYLDQIRPYFNSPAAMHLALESKYSMDREYAKEVVRKWLDYVDRGIDHPAARRQFLNWRHQLGGYAA